MSNIFYDFNDVFKEAEKIWKMNPTYEYVATGNVCEDQSQPYYVNLIGEIFQGDVILVEIVKEN